MGLKLFHLRYCERLWVKRARSRELPSAVTYGSSQQRIYRLVLISGTYSMEQKDIVFICKTYIRDEPARPDPTRSWGSLTAYFSNLLKLMSLNILRDMEIGFKIYRIEFWSKYSLRFQKNSDFREGGFVHIFLYIT